MFNRRGPALSSIESQIVLIEHYEKAFGLYDHQHEKAPSWSLTTPLQFEEVDGRRKSREYLKRFRDMKVYETYGISWNAFLDMTVPECEELLRDSVEKISAESTSAKNIISDINQINAEFRNLTQKK